MLGSIVGVRSCHVVLLLVCVDLLVLSLVVDRLHFVLIELLLLCLCSLCGSHAIHILIVIDLHLVRQLWFYQIHLGSKLSRLFQRSFILARIAWILTTFHHCLFCSFSSIILSILRLHLHTDALSRFFSTLRSQGCVELVRIAMTSNKRCLLVGVYLSVALHDEVCLYSIKVITLTAVMLRRHIVVLTLVHLVCNFSLVLIWLILHLIFQIHYHLLLLVVKVLVWRGLGIEVHVSFVDSCLLGELWKVRDFGCMVWC